MISFIFIKEDKLYHLSCVGLTRNQAAVTVRWTYIGCLGRTEPKQWAELDVDLAWYITAMQKLLDRVIQEGSKWIWIQITFLSYFLTIKDNNLQ